MCIRVLFVMLSLVLTSYVRAGHHEEQSMQSSFSDYQSFASSMQGRWVAKIIWINDWPGFGKRGDEVTGYAEYQFRDDGRVLNGRTYVGPGSLTHLIYYDEGKQQIQETMVSSGGNVWNNTIYRKDDEWTYRVSGSTGDGEAITGMAKREFSADGQRNQWLGQWKVNGVELDPLRDSFQRIGD